MIPSSVKKYLDTRGLCGLWKIAGTQQGGFEGAVVIPSLAETDFLFTTLHALAQNPSELLQRFLIVVVVNHREDAPLSAKMDNHQTLQRLAARKPSLDNLHLAWVDAASSGLELPKKTGGVGLARKIGMDLALPRFDYAKVTPLLISLDADTLVRPDYLSALIRHFQDAKVSGAVIPFCHQPGSTPEEDRAIKRYELFLRAYVLGLSRAGSPYAFHTVGSAMACSAQAYVRMGGMNVRAAGEDFYFLQQLAKTGGISKVKGTVVYPSPRASYRVPFGTGRSIFRLLAKEEGAILFYQTACFQVLKDWLDLVAHNVDAPGEEIRDKTKGAHLPLTDFLDRVQFPAVWNKLKKNFRSPSTMLSGFHGWFDGLKTMKLIHHLAASPFPRQEPEEVLPGLLEWAGLNSVQGIADQLVLLRKIQIGEAY
jgi:hypothetical protein